MKLTDDLVKKFGADKLLHLCIAGWLVSLSSGFGIVCMIVTSALLIILSVAKELWFDDHPDARDVTAAIVGISFTWMTYLISMVL